MKYFLMDKALEFLLVLALDIWYLIHITNHLQDLPLYGFIILLIFGLLLLVGIGYLCRKLLLFPVDLLFGKMTQIAFFYHGCLQDDYEFFRKVCCFNYVFGNGKENISLIFPTTCPVSEKDNIDDPPKNKRLIISYYRFSKILISWEVE